jgi:two-component system, cell cycle response regulator
VSGRLATGPAGGLARSGDLVPLIERTDHLHALRAALACAVLGAAAWAPDLVRTSLADVAGPTAAFLVVSLLAEWLRRRTERRALWLIGAALLADGAYLAWVVYLTGGSQSPLWFLVYLHVVAVTLLASYRTGLKLALWQTFLLLGGLYAQAAGILGLREALPSALPGGPAFGKVAVLRVAALWGMALGTAAFASLIERELRRQKTDLEALADMAAELDERIEAPGIARILLARLADEFGFRRGAVLGSPRSELSLLAHIGLDGPGDMRPGMDRLVERAWDRGEVVLARSVDPKGDPRLASLIPSARNVLVVPLMAEGHPLGILVLEHPRKRDRIPRRRVSVIQQFASHAALALHNAWLLEDVRRMAETDPLTGLANRRVFQAALERELSRAARTGRQVSLVMLDVDHFKQYNDEHGHPAGDRLLRAVADALMQEARAFDTVARYGGEEFAVVLPECGARDCPAVAERLRRAAAANDEALTLSAGAATFPGDATDAESLVEVADAALYRSKRAGRDRLSLPLSRSIKGEPPVLVR